MGMYKGRQLDNQQPAPRLRLMRTAEGSPVDITDALEAERQRLAAANADARRERSRGNAAAVAIGCFVSMLFILTIAWAASLMQAHTVRPW